MFPVSVYVTEQDPANQSPTDEDRQKAGELKMQANDAKSSGDLDKAIKLLTDAIQLAASPLTYGKRAEILLKSKRPGAAINDCTTALSSNPDSCKNLKIRGQAYFKIGQYEKAAADLRKAMAIDARDCSSQQFSIARSRKTGCISKKSY